MSKKILFADLGWEDYLYWQTQDKKTLKKINALIKDISRNDYGGLGKAEPLIGNLSGFHSVRIDKQNRLIFRITNDKIEIAQCKGHYGDK